MKKIVYCLMGPTCSGKTALAIELVKHKPFSIISVDSTMVYKGMDIGSAKPTTAELKEAPHQLIDIRDPAQPYSAADFCDDAIALINKCHQQNQLPLLVGGTMLYFKALQQGLSPLPKANPEIREQLLNEAKTKGWQALHQQLLTIDPVAGKRIHPNDPQRLQRALEVYRQTGKTITELQNQNTCQHDFNFVNIALIPEDRELLRQKIALRFQQMLDHGFLQEVQALYQRPDLNLDLPSMRAVGYRQAWQYLSGAIDYETMKTNTITATRQLAKRQLTWLRSWDNTHCFDSETVAVKEVLKLLKAPNHD